MTQCNTCKGTRKIRLFSSIVDCDCVKPDDQLVKDFEDGIKKIADCLRKVANMLPDKIDVRY
jgi:hypothetical protein